MESLRRSRRPPLTPPPPPAPPLPSAHSSFYSPSFCPTPPAPPFPAPPRRVVGSPAPPALRRTPPRPPFPNARPSRPVKLQVWWGTGMHAMWAACHGGLSPLPSRERGARSRAPLPSDFHVGSALRVPFRSHSLAPLAPHSSTHSSHPTTRPSPPPHRPRPAAGTPPAHPTLHPRLTGATRTLRRRVRAPMPPHGAVLAFVCALAAAAVSPSARPRRVLPLAELALLLVSRQDSPFALL